MNEYDSNRICDLVSTIGYKKTDTKKEADCFILNTCNIREKAAEKVYDEIEKNGYPTPSISLMNLLMAEANDYQNLVDNLLSEFNQLDGLLPVSYTHLTLPTIYSV